MACGPTGCEVIIGATQTDFFFHQSGGVIFSGSMRTFARILPTQSVCQQPSGRRAWEADSAVWGPGRWVGAVGELRAARPGRRPGPCGRAGRGGAQQPGEQGQRPGDGVPSSFCDHSITSPPCLQRRSPVTGGTLAKATSSHPEPWGRARGCTQRVGGRWRIICTDSEGAATPPRTSCSHGGKGGWGAADGAHWGPSRKGAGQGSGSASLACPPTRRSLEEQECYFFFTMLPFTRRLPHRQGAPPRLSPGGKRHLAKLPKFSQTSVKCESGPGAELHAPTARRRAPPRPSPTGTPRGSPATCTISPYTRQGREGRDEWNCAVASLLPPWASTCFRWSSNRGFVCQ